MASFLSIARSQGRRSRQIQELEHREKVLLTAMETIETIGHWAESGANFCWGKHGKTIWKIHENSRSRSAGTADEWWNFSLSSNLELFFSHTIRLHPLDWKRQISSNIIWPHIMTLVFQVTIFSFSP